MRLLNARNLELVDVTDDAIPPYAILSHTWGNEEITIQQLRRLRGWSQMKGLSLKSLDKNKRAIASKQGFMKVENAAQLAVSRGLNYIWIDTCCIDKTSSAELSEAINSMYLWYKRSAECYAFLADVDPGVGGDSSAIYYALHNSRWFTRGWTLQELVAPKAVLFYARDWTPLGRKDSPVAFTKAISEITRIDEEILDGRIDPLQLSVSARMAWASHRNTTRLEDMAYSLMGLFEVNMPLLYGEGRRAFTRLQEEIIQHTDDQSLFAWNSLQDKEEDPDALFGMLAESPAQFKDSGKLQPLPPLPIYASAPSAITNQGLRIQLYLRPVPVPYGEEESMEEDYYAILDCVMRVDDAYQCPVILLRRLSEDQYGRLQTMSQQFVPPPLSHYIPELEGYRSVYVRQQPVYYHLPQFRLSPLHMESGASPSDGVQYRLLDTFPSHQWNSTTMTLKVDYSRKLRAMGIFRFQSASKTNDQVDVVVGLRRLNTMEWEGWCFQLSDRQRTLEDIFRSINDGIESITENSFTEITSRTLRDSLGDDSSLVSNATVEGIQLQGRLYISVLVTPTAEIQTMVELSNPPSISNLVWKTNRSFAPVSDQDMAKRITEICSRSSRTEVAVDLAPSDWRSQPVRVCEPSDDDDAMDSARGNFMKPIYDFLGQIKEKQSESGYVSLSEEFATVLFNGDVKKVEQILTRQPDLELFTNDLYGFLPLHWAVAGGSPDCVRLLLTNGANRCRATRNGLSISHVAALCNTRVWANLPHLSGYQAGPKELAFMKTERHFDTALHLAAACSPDSDYGKSCFEEALTWGSEYLGVLPRNAYDETPLHRAAAKNNATIIRLIASRSWSFFPDVVDQYGRTPMWHAAAAGACDAIKALIALGASLYLPDDLGRSPLHAACRGGYDEAVRVLLQNGADVNMVTHALDLTPMDFACIFGHLSCLTTLFNQRPYELSSSARINKALHLAASCGWHDSVDFLCSRGGNPFVEMSHYLRLSTGCAELVHHEGDARSVAGMELHGSIVNFFDTSDTCHRYRIGREPVYSAPEVVNVVDTMPAALPPSQTGSAPAYPPPQRSDTIGYHKNYGNPSQSAPTPLYQPPSTSSADYFTPSHQQSANLPARISSTNPYTPTPPNQGYRMQDMVDPYDMSKSQNPYYARPASNSMVPEPRYQSSSIAAAPPQKLSLTSQSATVAVRASSTPSYQAQASSFQSAPAEAPTGRKYAATPYPANPYR